jgi:hypothetical protein
MIRIYGFKFILIINLLIKQVWQLLIATLISIARQSIRYLPRAVNGDTEPITVK